jgi:hypothetical protein
MAGYLVKNASGKIVSEVIDDRIDAMTRVVRLNEMYQTNDYWYENYDPTRDLTGE